MVESEYIHVDEALLKRFEEIIENYDFLYPELSDNRNDSGALTYTPVVDIDLAMLRDVKGLVTKQVIMDLFGCEDAKARGIFIDMMRFDCAFQMGKTYYSTKEHTQHYIVEIMGQDRKVL